jgi:hypothetical protein
MDKLFDLMVMGYKYQVMCCTALHDMLQVRGGGTITHHHVPACHVQLHRVT